MAAENQQARPARLGDAGAEPALQRVEVVRDLSELNDVPAVGLEASGHVVGVGQLGRAVDADVVVVVDVDEATQSEVPCQRRRLVADAFLEVAVRADREHAVVHDLGSEPRAEIRFGECDAHAVGEALTERPGGDLDSLQVAVLGVPGRS